MPIERIVAQVTEEVLIVYADFTSLGIHHLRPNVLVLISHLVSMRIELTVWTDDTIAVEVVVARIILIIVATVGILYLAQVLVVHLARQDAHWLLDMAMQSLVNEIPVEATLENRILTSQVPVFLQVTTRVTHGVIVLALDERLVAVRILAILLAIPNRIIHRAIDVGAFAMTSLLVLYRASLVLTLNPLVSFQEVVAHLGLVTQTPSDDGWMVIEHGHVVLVALQDLLGKLRLACGSVVAITESMTLLVSLSHYIETILIAKVVPTRVVRIVTGTNGVDVQTLHDHDVLNHASLAHVITSIWVYLMTVGTLDEYWLPVDQELLVLDFHRTEAHLYLHELVWRILSSILDRRNHKRIEIRGLGRPLAHILDTQLILSHTVFYLVGTGNDYLLAVRIIQS